MLFTVWPRIQTGHPKQATIFAVARAVMSLVLQSRCFVGFDGRPDPDPEPEYEDELVEMLLVEDDESLAEDSF
jgi:hypothetical protein